MKVRLRPDPRFRVEGHDLRSQMKVSPWEAALGARIPVPTLDGEVKLTVPGGSQSGQTLRLRNRGLPRRNGPQGDLLVELKVVVPKKLSSKEKRLFRQLQSESTFDPRK